MKETPMTTYFFPDCRLNVSNCGETTTHWNTTHVLARWPRPAEDKLLARCLGYGADTRRFRREHDVLLHTLAALQGQESSPLLHALAFGEADAGWAAEAEEDFAAHVHRWLNLDIWSDEIERLLHLGWEKAELRGFLRAVLEGEITVVEAPLTALAV